MSTPLLKTKLYVPSIRPDSFAGGPQSALRARLVARPRLIERLENGFRQGSRLTLVSAPAGYGKTTLLGEWIAQSELRTRVAWVSLDKDDNDPARFWAYVVAALQTAQADLGEIAQSVFQSSQPPPIESALTGLLNQIAELPAPIVLVLDDYHVIQGDAVASQAIHGAIGFLLDNMPQQMHLVLATRADPPLPIPRLRGRGQLTGLYQSDLRFTSAEIARFLDLVLGVKLSTKDVTVLEGRTEGWIAGLQMAALAVQALAQQVTSTRGREDVTAFIRAFAGSHRYIFDYLGEEVLRQQHESVQRFLLQTSVLDQLTGSLCDAVVGIGASTHLQIDEPPNHLFASSQALLEHLERNNLFVVPLDDERRWYRYHHLFSGFLRQRLQRERRDLVPELHRRASEWYQTNKLTAEAVNHALAAEDWERAVGLVDRVAWVVLSRGEMTTLLSWLSALPDELVRSQPQLVVLHVWALALTGQLDAVESCLSDIDVQQVRGEATAVRAYVAIHRDEIALAIELCHQAFELLPEEKWFSRGITALNLGLAYWRSGDLQAASRAMTQAIVLGREADQKYLVLRAIATLGHVQKMQGSLGQAVETHRRALELAEEPAGRPAPFAGIAYVGIAESLYEWNDLDGAMRYAIEGIRLSELGGRASYVIAGNTVLARVYQARGDLDTAIKVLREAQRLAQRHDFAYLRAEVAELQARLWEMQGNWAAISRWAQVHRVRDLDKLGLTMAREMEQIGVARAMIASISVPRTARKSEIGAALALLARLLKAAEEAERRGSLIKILPLQARAFQAWGDLDRALSALERALSLAAPEGYVRTFVEEGEPMARLLRQALSRGIAPNYVARLLAAFGQEVEVASPVSDPLVEPLSEREQQVLRLIVAGLSNSEIADELVIAVSTVKSHVNHIFGKLGVDSRTRAVAKARELGVL